MSEAIYSFVNLIGLYHDRLLNRPPRAALSCELKCGEDTPTTRTAKTLLTIVHHTEVLMEMLARRRFEGEAVAAAVMGDSLGSFTQQSKSKWMVILVIELFKAMWRLLLLRNNKFRMLMPPNLNDVAKKQAEVQAIRIESSLSPEAAQFKDVVQMYVTHGRSVNGHPHGKFSAFTDPKLLATDSDSAGAAKASVDESFNASHVVGEVLHIMRPAAYVAMRWLWVGHENSQGRASWWPFLLSLGVDVAARACYRNLNSLSPVEREEIYRRTAGWAYYFVRSPLFEALTKRPLVWTTSLLARLPLIGFLFGNLLELCLSLQSFHFYTSNS